LTKPTIFISHITEEGEIATSIKKLIEESFLRNVNVFVSSNADSLCLGDEWINIIRQSIDNCQLVIILCSPYSISRPWINFEAGAAWVQQTPIIPLCHSGLSISQLPIPLKNFQGGSLNSEETIKQLFNKIASILECGSPNANVKKFLELINEFETKEKTSRLAQDINYVKALLGGQINMLKNNIIESTTPLMEPNSVQFATHTFAFSDIKNMFYPSLIQGDLNKRVYEFFFESTKLLLENVKFILASPELLIPDELKKILWSFVIEVSNFEYIGNWISTLLPDIKSTSAIMNDIEKSDGEPEFKNHSNVLDYCLDYYNIMIKCQSWVLQYEKYINEHSSKTI